MILKPQNFEIINPLENYADKLCYYMKFYLKLMDTDFDNKSFNRNENAKVVIRWIIFPNEREFVKDYNRYVYDKLDNKTFKMIRKYTKCIMQLLGKIAECIIIDRCNSEPEMNMRCINFATFRKNIFECYETIPYSEYIAFGTSFEHIIFKNQAGLYEQRENLDYNPQHTQKDIGWCKRDNFLWQLHFENREFNCADNAKLQVKASLGCTGSKFDKYVKTFTPVICFDLNNDFYKIQNAPSHLLISARDINPEMELEMEQYFRILGAYATGLIPDFNLNDLKIKENPALEKLFNTPIIDIVTKERLKEVGVIDYIKKFGKPIIIGT